MRTKFLRYLPGKALYPSKSSGLWVGGFSPHSRPPVNPDLHIICMCTSSHVNSYNIQLYVVHVCGTCSHMYVVYTQVSSRITNQDLYFLHVFTKVRVHSTLAPPLPCPSINALKNPQANLSIVSFYVSVLILPTFVLI